MQRAFGRAACEASSAAVLRDLPKTKAELEELAGLEAARTPEQAKYVGEDAERSVSRFLEGAGIAFDAKALAACDGFFMKRRKEEKAAVEAAKNSFCRCVRS